MNWIWNREWTIVLKTLTLSSPSFHVTLEHCLAIMQWGVVAMLNAQTKFLRRFICQIKQQQQQQVTVTTSAKTRWLRFREKKIPSHINTMSVPFPGAIEFRHQNPGHSFAFFWHSMKCDNWHSSHCNRMTKQPGLWHRKNNNVLENVSLWRKKR